MATNRLSPSAEFHTRNQAVSIWFPRRRFQKRVCYEEHFTKQCDHKFQTVKAIVSIKSGHPGPWVYRKIKNTQCSTASSLKLFSSGTFFGFWFYGGNSKEDLQHLQDGSREGWSVTSMIKFERVHRLFWVHPSTDSIQYMDHAPLSWAVQWFCILR